MSGVEGLRAAAEAATPGPWVALPPHGWDTPVFNELLIYKRTGLREQNLEEITPGGGEHGDDGLRGHDAAYIAAANPTVILGLLDRLADAEAAVERVRAVIAAGDVRTLDDFRETCILQDDLRDALDGPQWPVGDAVELGGAGDDSGPQIEAEARCQFISPTPWGPAQCVLPDGHDEHHAYSPSEAIE